MTNEPKSMEEILLEEVSRLVHRHGIKAIRRTLAKFTRAGAPRKADAYKFQVWLAVELFRFYMPAASVKCACDGVATFFRNRSRRAKSGAGEKSWGIHATPHNPHSVRRIHSDVGRQLSEDHWLRHLLKMHICQPCVVISKSGPKDPKFANTIEVAICDVWV